MGVVQNTLGTQNIVRRKEIEWRIRESDVIENNHKKGSREKDLNIHQNGFPMSLDFPLLLCPPYQKNNSCA